MNKHVDNTTSDDKNMEDFFTPIPDELFKKMQKAIENYDKKSEIFDDNNVSSEAFTTEMLIELSKKLIADKKIQKHK